MEFKDGSFVLLTIDTLTLLILFLLKFLMEAIFRDKIENYLSCSRLVRQDRDYHMTILVFRDENEISYGYSHVSRQD